MSAGEEGSDFIFSDCGALLARRRPTKTSAKERRIATQMNTAAAIAMATYRQMSPRR